MSLDIGVYQDNEQIHYCNFYGFKNYNNPNRVELALKSGFEKVKDFWDYETYIRKYVDKAKQQFYLDLITDQNAGIEIKIF